MGRPQRRGRHRPDRGLRQSLGEENPTAEERRKTGKPRSIPGGHWCAQSEQRNKLPAYPWSEGLQGLRIPAMASLTLGVAQSGAPSGVNRSVRRAARWNALMVGLAALHCAVLVVAPSVTVIALGLWWNSNTISHNF